MDTRPQRRRLPLGPRSGCNPQPLSDGFHIGFQVDGPERVASLRNELDAGGARVALLEDFRPTEAYVTFRCWDPDDTEIEIFWQA